MRKTEKEEYYTITPQKLKEYRAFCKELGVPREEADAFIRQLKAFIKSKEFGKRGGTATAKNLTAKQRKESASKAAKARWAKKKKETR